MKSFISYNLNWMENGPITHILYIVHISGMTVTDVKTPIKIVGLEEAPISDIVLRDIHIQGGKQKCIFEDCERITMDDVIVNGEELKLK